MEIYGLNKMAMRQAGSWRHAFFNYLRKENILNL
jgi:hypothetical protein